MEQFEVYITPPLTTAAPFTQILPGTAKYHGTQHLGSMGEGAILKNNLLYEKVGEIL